MLNLCDEKDENESLERRGFTSNPSQHYLYTCFAYFVYVFYNNLKVKYLYEKVVQTCLFALKRLIC